MSWLWRSAQHRHLYWSSKLLIGTMLTGFGLFNTAEGILNHHILGLHHVNETLPRGYWIYWDIAFTMPGLAMLAAGRHLTLQGERESAVTRERKP